MSSAWPMLERCWLAQWRSLTELQRSKIDWEWRQVSKNGCGSPGMVGTLGHKQHSLWHVERTGPDGDKRIVKPGDYLIAVKYDTWPDETNKEGSWWH